MRPPSKTTRMHRLLLWALSLGVSAGTIIACGSEDDGASPTDPDAASPAPNDDAGPNPSQDGGGGADADAAPPFSDGVTTKGFGKGQDSLRDVARQADDKIIGVGEVNDAIGSSPYKRFPFVFRLAGSVLDPSFGAGGKTFLPFEGAARAVVVQSDQKIVVTGMTLNADATQENVFVARLLPTGALDPSLGNGAGFVIAMPGAGEAVTVQSDGKIVVAGEAYQPLRTQIVRFLSNGAIDTSFGASASGSASFSVTPTFGYQAPYSYAVSIQPDNKIVVAAGNSIIRATDTGAPDTTFDGDGLAATGFTTGSRDLALAPDGKIIVSGDTGGSNTIKRYDGAGVIDTSFGGLNTGSTDTTPLTFFESMTRLTDGTLVLSGGARIVKYSADGARDMTFGGAGMVQHGAFNSARHLVLGSGQIVIAGLFYNSIDYVLDTGFLRYSSTGAADNAFGSAYNMPGLVAINSEASSEAATALAELPDGRVLATIDTSWRGIVGRFKPDLELDATFGNKQGLFRTRAYFDGISGARAVAVQPSGKIVFLAEKTGGLIGRLSADGVQETSGFGTGTYAALGTFNNRSPEIGLDASGSIYGAYVDGANTRVLHYSVDGVVDATFADNAGFASVPGAKRAFAVGVDGKLVFLMQAATPSIARLTAAGAADGTFNLTAGEIANALSVQPDGKMLIVSTTADGKTLKIERRSSDGSLDTTFGTSGSVTESITKTLPATDQPARIAVLSNGNIAVAFTESTELTAIRYLPNGSRDTSFGTSGKRVITNPANRYFVRALAPGANGAMLVGGGAFTPSGGVDLALVRLN